MSFYSDELKKYCLNAVANKNPNVELDSNNFVLGHILAALTLAFIFLSPAAFAQPKYEKSSEIPTESFAALPSFSTARLSPNGKKIAHYIAIDGRRNLSIQNLDGSDRTVIPPGNDETEFLGYYWKTNTVIICTIGQTGKVPYAGMVTSGRIISFDLSTRKMQWLGKPKKSMRRRGMPLFNERVVSYLPQDSDHILLQLNFNYDVYPEVYKVNVLTGRRSEVQARKSGVNSWYADLNHEVRLGIGYRLRSNKLHIYYKINQGKMIDLKNAGWSKNYEFVGFTNNTNLIYVEGLNEYGTKGLYTLDISKGKIIDHIFSHPEVDISGPVYHPVTNEIAGVSYTHHFSRIKYLDSNLSKIQRGLEKVLPGLIVTVVDQARNTNLYLVHAESNTNPGEYYLYDRDMRELSWISRVREQIDPVLMASTEAIKITMRDNTKIGAYLSMPIDRDAINLPSIILPHGGPQERDIQEWDWWSQFYVSRGYLVLRPNFRGSDGFGPEFLEAGENQWGGLMQDDVTDATKWLIAAGMADPDRICIVGTSYGGYAALMGVIKEADLYKCAISVNGVPNLPAMKAYDKKTRLGAKGWTDKMGLKDTKDRLVSPYHRAKDINVPVLLISSVDDARVPYKQSKNMHRRLKKLKKDSRYVKLENGTHYMQTAESRLITLRETEKFLREHIGN